LHLAQRGLEAQALVTFGDLSLEPIATRGVGAISVEDEPFVDGFGVIVEDSLTRKEALENEICS
jgi:hypothetical protein